MCSTSQIHQTSHRNDEDKLSSSPGIGDLFRDYGEEYISQFKPSIQQIKLIRAIRICKTPALGGKNIKCNDCGHSHYTYFGCGHSHCMLCQNIKREQWVDKLKTQLLHVPYVHCVFTLPHQLNSLARQNQSLIYSLIMKSAWATIRQIGHNQKFSPGLTSILHTFGSDMKYHIHVHALVTFGGVDSENNWKSPHLKNKLDRFRSISKLYKDTFIFLLRESINKQTITYHSDLNALISDVQKLRWVVHSTHPTMDTAVIENYLARYINRVAISKKRLQYIKQNNEVRLIYNDYKNQISGQPAPKAYKSLEPLTAIDQILQHVLPPYFQKSRRYGLHHNNSKVKASLKDAIKRNRHIIRTVFEIITHLSKLTPYACENCGSENYTIEPLIPDKEYIYNFLNKGDKQRPPPNNTQINAA